MKVSSQVKAWLSDSRPRARKLVTEEASYRDAMAELMFFYSRAMVAKLGKPVKAAPVMGVGTECVRKYTRPPKIELTMESRMTAQAWAVVLAGENATFREAMFVFRCTLIEAAIELADGNRGAAARMLKVHRNTMWQKLPSSPAEIWPTDKKGK
jgi:DNA-binding NtrC family response regulator